MHAMMRKTSIFLLALALCTAVSAQAPLRTTVRQLQGSAALNGATWGVLAVRLGGDTLAAYNADRRLIPASNVKVITAGTALHALGADWRFRTDLAYSGRIVDGVLQGDLYIIGGGDPTTASKYDCAVPTEELFTQWKDIIEAAGIRAIEGTIVGDGRPWGGRVPCKDWSAEDLGFYYGAAPGALNFYENAQDFTVAPADSVGKPVSVTPFFPDAPWMIFNHAAVTGAQGSGDQLMYDASSAGPFGRMYGKFGIDRKSKVEECINLFPEYTCAYYFHNFLVEHGMSVSNAFAEVSPYGLIRRDMFLYDDGERAATMREMTRLGGTQSPPLLRIVGEMMKRSDNFYAEAVLKALGQDTYGRAVLDSALLAEKRVLGQLGLKTDGVVQLRDGSGLARTNYVSPAFFVQFLRTMARQAEYRDFRQCFPQPGQGTLAARMSKADPALKRRVYMKSGSMNGVRCFCGYVTPADGRTEQTIVFSLMINNATAPSAALNPVIDQLLTAIASQ